MSGNNFIKTDIYIILPFIYEKPIILGQLKIVTLKFTMYILMILKHSLRLYFLGK